MRHRGRLWDATRSLALASARGRTFGIIETKRRFCAKRRATALVRSFAKAIRFDLVGVHSLNPAHLDKNR